MKQTLLVAGLGIAVLLGGSLFLMTIEAAPAPVADALPPVPLAPPASAAPPSLRKSVGGPGPARAGWKAAAEAPTPMADRVIRKAVRKALLAAPLQSRLSRCVDADVGFGGGTVGPTPRAQPAVLLLEMETFESEVRIGQAQVQTWGGASEQTVSCAREVLSGQVIRTSGIEGGQRLRMPFPLNPRIALVDASR